MFSGIIHALGTIQAIAVPPHGAGKRLSVSYGNATSDPLVSGESIAVNGVCLTVTACHTGAFSVDLSRETLSKTTFQYSEVGDRVNIERALTASTRLSGHMVTGHIDGVADISRYESVGDGVDLSFSVVPALLPFIAVNGSICVHGISLTVTHVHADGFSVSVIPYTLQHTTLRSAAVGTQVNIEVDIISRYCHRLLQFDQRVSAEPTEQILEVL